MRKIISAAFAAILLLGLTSCVSDIAAPSEEKSYASGDAVITEPVSSIVVDWSDGSINVVSADSDAITFSEVSNAELTADHAMSWNLDGETLYIHYTAPGIFSIVNVKKDLTLTLPADFSGKLISLSTSAANIRADRIVAAQVELSTSSGDVDAVVNADQLVFSSSSGNFKLAAEADEIEGSSSSGNIELTQNGNASEVEFTTSSGKITADMNTVNELEVSSSSGSIDIQSKTVGSADCSTSSAEIKLTVADALGSADISSSSGGVKLRLPESLDFDAEVETSSGDFTSDFALVSNGEHHVHGTGTTEVEIETVSGNIEIMINH